MSKKPVIIEIEDGQGKATAALRPEQAAPVPETVIDQSTAAMTRAVKMATRRPSRIVRLLWTSAVGLLGFIVSLAAWDYVTGLLSRSPVLGAVAGGLLALFVLAAVGMALGELLALRRLGRLGGVRAEAERAAADGDLGAARQVVERLETLYHRRDDMAWALARLAEQKADPVDADTLLGLAEARLMQPLDALALREVEAAVRQVATVTAIVPLALADVAAALISNLRMIRRVAEIYGGRGGTMASWRLVRAVMGHLVATGAVAVGDDLIGSIAGGGVVSKLSRRFGEGVINGALTARVGMAAIEVCRPLPYASATRPSVTGMVRRALTGLFGGS